MIELKKVCNLTQDAAKFISSWRRQNKLPQTDTTETPRLLNQEKDGVILFTWDDATEYSKGSIVSHVGLYDTALQKYQLLWTYSQRVNIVSCSINQTRSLLAFTVCRKDTSSTKKKDVYTAFIAEIQVSNTRVFSLNLERSYFLKVQFLYSSQVSDKECHMIVMLHRESIGLYRIQLGRVGDKGIVMRDQPSTEQLAKKFYWCQWDATHQRLYYIHYQRYGKADNQQVQPYISSVQFYDKAQHDNVLDVPIHFPFPQLRASPRQHYAPYPFHHGIPDLFLNLVVLTQSNGTYCVCYQHLTETPYNGERARSSSRRSRKSPAHTSPSSLNLSLSSENEEDVMEISYYICMVHHAKILHGRVMGIPFSAKHRLHFCWHSDYLMVTLPGHFTHLLNVGLEFEPCLHILLHDKTLRLKAIVNQASVTPEGSTPSPFLRQNSEDELPVSVLSTTAENLSHLSNTCLHAIQKDSPTDLYLFDYSRGDVWKVVVNTDILVDIFTETVMPSTRSALLHYVLLRTRDFWLLKRLFEMISNDIASPEVPGLMAEFLAGTTYSSMRRQVDRECLRLLPFTVTETFRGQYDKTRDNVMQARLTYSTLNSVKIGTRTAQDRQRRGNVGEDMWDTLRRHLQWKQLNNNTLRFSNSVIHKATHQLETGIGAKSSTKEQSTSIEKTFLSTFNTRISSSRTDSPSPSTQIDGSKRVRPDTVLGNAPPFLQSSHTTEASDSAMALTRDLLSNHMTRHMRKESKSKSQSVAKEYVYCQLQQSRQLCHLLWNLRGPLLPYTDLDFLPNLLDPCTEDEYELFQLFERYYQTCQDLAFPILQGFSSYFTAIGARVLNKSLFFQYIDRGVLRLTGDFMAQVLGDLPDGSENIKFKQQLISRLPVDLAEECYRQWNHPICQRYLAQKQVTQLLTRALSTGASDKAMDSVRGLQTRPGRSVDNLSLSSNRESMSFAPLDSFLHLLETLDRVQRMQSDAKVPPRRSPIDVHFLEEVALYHTRTETDYDLSTVNF
ncbi:protein pigeon-like [Mizuhopecten yessoensis]|uniref:Protein pigeon n=1 Tax=Mizuhopecten yessoensis TaxID=6573 RepID=A0A210PEY3_MIZYE|nr:protein pigeon-like [Mizuhopecten yessoensis]OWF35045.1 Protein pigeon [Mizuhopecten yessoensis]